VSSADYLRFPHIHGDLVTFVGEDDVWLAPATGGRAWRLSADYAKAESPRLSRDGTQVAWTSHKDGASEVYLASVDGGDARRLTYWNSPATDVCGWSPDGEILAVSAAGSPFEQLTWAHAIRAEADTPGSRRLPFGPVCDVAIEPGAVALLTGSLREPAWRKRYRGGTSGRLWLRAATPTADADQPFRQVAAELNGHLVSPMLIAGRLAFLSDHEGTGNIYSIADDGSDLRRHTDHDGPYARQASTDGERIIYSCRGELWLLDGLDAAGPRQLDINLGGAVAGRAPRLISAADHIGSLACDHTGQASAVEVRGTVHWLTHRDGPATALDVSPDARARQPRVLGQAGLVVWVTDADGADALEIAEVPSGDGGRDAQGAVGQPARRRVASGAIGWVASLASAPDGSAVAVAARDGHLRIVNVGTGEVTELARSDNGNIAGLAWSPDSAWLAWAEPAAYPGETQLSRLRIARPSDGQIHDVTDGRFADSDPVFSADGRYLAFLSKRSFDPIYDAHFFDLSFPYGARPFLLPLAAATPSPFAPRSGGRRIGDGPAKPGGGDDEAAKIPAVTVDTDGMAARVIALPVPESRYKMLHAVKDGLAWLREPVTGNLGMGGARLTDDKPRPVLERFDFNRQSVIVLQDGVDWFAASGDGSRLVVKAPGGLTVIPADRKADPENPDDNVEVDASRARFLADPVAMWRHAFDEAGRFMAHDFWVADMSGVDWDAVLAEYRPLTDRIACPNDFVDVLWETFGELGTSHAYVGRNGDDDSAAGAAGQLGADLASDGDGNWSVGRVVPGESSDPRARSPLSGPGAQLSAGDRLVAVDGLPVGPAGPGPLLVGTAGKPVELTVASGPGAEQRRVVVTPLASETRLRYQDWVAGRRALVRELSGGRLGYLHVPDMVSEGWADFHRDLRTEMVKEGLILDVRSNRGGHTSQLVIEKLARRIIGWAVPRGMQPVSYPEDAPRGAIVALTDEWAGSDGDIVTAAIRTLQLAPVVGARTWGGVIGIDAGHELVEGTVMTVPRYPFWFDGRGWGVENYGVDPDVEVLITPDDWAAGRDSQLEHAVRMALAALAEYPALTPPDLSALPSRARPPLPPRGGEPSASHDT
jgi:tricorn protease